MIRRLFFPFLFLAIAPLRAMSPPELAPGLAYFRITDLTKDAADVITALGKDSVVLDLRCALGSPEAAAALGQRLEKPHPGGHGVWLILINPSSAADIVDVVSRPHPHQLTVGPRTPALAPDIAVSTSAEEDRRAYDALASGTPLEKLISSNPEKKRFDEAALARTRAKAAADSERDAEDADSPELADTPAHPATEKAPAPPPAIPHDLVLERAAQIYRALLVGKH